MRWWRVVVTSAGLMGAPGAWVGLGGVHVLDAYIHGCGAWVGGGIEVQVYELTGKITILYMFLEFLGDCEHLCARPPWRLLLRCCSCSAWLRSPLG